MEVICSSLRPAGKDTATNASTYFAIIKIAFYDYPANDSNPWTTGTCDI